MIMNKLNINSIKKQAVLKTLELFNDPKYISLITRNGLYLPTDEALLKYLNLMHGEMNQTITLTIDRSQYDKDGLISDLKIKLKEYNNGILTFTDSYIFNTINTFKIDGLVNDYCLLFFWYLFNKELLDVITITNSAMKKKKQTTYKWETNPEDELPDLYTLMKDKHKLIAPETTLDQFRAIFTGQDTEIIIPVKWHEDNASELIYFDKSICELLYKTSRANFVRMAACFVKPDGQRFEGSFKELKNTIEINLSDEKQKIIDSIISNFT